MKYNHKTPAVLLCAALLLQAGLAGCAAAQDGVMATVQPGSEATETTAETGAETTTDTTAAATATTVQNTVATAEYTDRDKDGSWDADKAVTIACNGDSATVTGNGATAEAGIVTITAAGVYVFTGNLNGKIVVAAGENDKVQLVLNGVTVTCNDGPAINAQTADKVFVTLADDTKNTLADGGSYAQTDENAPNACLYAQCDLTINSTGTGTLAVTGNYNHGIVTKDDLRITGGNITVNAVNDGIKGRDSVSVCGGVLDITAGGDGIQANNDEDEAKGWVCIDGGSFAIVAGGDGIQAETQMQISGGDFMLQTGGGADNAKNLAADTSAKGLKAGGTLTITGGTVNANCADDAVHTNGNAQITAGALTLASGDDGIHADATLTITGGSIAVTQSYEGLEGEVVEISDGDITVVAADDGINCAGGTDGGTGGAFGTDTFAHGGMGGMGDTDGNAQLNISGGTIVVQAEGDGLDSNGVMTISGGIVLVAGPTNGGNGALDTGTTATVNGGCIIAVGSTAMAVNFDSGSQGSWLADTGNQTAGTRLSLLDAEGNVLLSWAPDKDYACAVLSCAALTEGESYTVNCGGELAGVEGDENGFAQAGTVTGGTEAASVTLSALQTSDVAGMGGRGGRGDFGDKNGMGDMGGMGGMKGDRGTFGGTAPDGMAGATPPDGTDAASDAQTPPDAEDAANGANDANETNAAAGTAA